MDAQTAAQTANRLPLKRPSIKTTIRPIPSLSCLEATSLKACCVFPGRVLADTLSLGARGLFRYK